MFKREEFKYSNNVVNLIKEEEGVIEVNGRYYVGNYIAKSEFVKKFGGEK